LRGGGQRRPIGSSVLMLCEFGAPEDEPAAHLLRMALSVSKKGDTKQSQRYVERARALSPDFWECDRVDAFIASTQQQRERAASLYRSALAKAESPESRAVVCHFFSGHLARAMQEPELALPYAEEAHQLFRNADTALAYGNLLVWNGRFAEGQELLEVAADESSGRTRLIALTGVVESWRRWGEELLKTRQPLEAFDKAGAGFNVGSDAISRAYYDLRLADATVESIAGALWAAGKPGVKTRAVETRLRKMMQGVAKEIELYASTRTWPRFQAGLSRWLQAARPLEESRILGNFLLARQRTPNDNRLIGEIISWAGRYGFIKHPDYPSNAFFHRGSFLEPDIATSSPLQGSTVYFAVERDEDGRHSAVEMSLVGTPHSLG
jgi:tetratricopeptide (TPR) repeat protein